MTRKTPISSTPPASEDYALRVLEDADRFPMAIYVSVIFRLIARVSPRVFARNSKGFPSRHLQIKTNITLAHRQSPTPTRTGPALRPMRLRRRAGPRACLPNLLSCGNSRLGSLGRVYFDLSLILLSMRFRPSVICRTIALCDFVSIANGFVGPSLHLQHLTEPLISLKPFFYRIVASWLSLLCLCPLQIFLHLADHERS